MIDWRLEIDDFGLKIEGGPCVRLAVRLNRPDIIKRFTNASRSGFYLAVEQEGEIGAGDEIRLISSDPRHLTVTSLYRLKLDGGSVRDYEAAAAHPVLSSGWRKNFQARFVADA